MKTKRRRRKQNRRAGKVDAAGSWWNQLDNQEADKKKLKTRKRFATAGRIALAPTTATKLPLPQLTASDHILDREVVHWPHFLAHNVDPAVQMAKREVQ